MTATAAVPATKALVDPAFLTIPLGDLVESPKNPRKHYDAAALQQLADNLVTVGQITPIIVRPHPSARKAGKYEIAAGHRRCRAARLAGLLSLQAIVRELDDCQMAEILNLENLQRDDLNPIEEAQGFRTLMEDAGYDIRRLAERMNLSERSVYDRLALLRLIPEAQDLIAKGVLSPAHGALLARLTAEDQRRAIDADLGGALDYEQASPEHFPGVSELELNDARKPRTVRELKEWINEHVRFEPEQAVQADLAMDLPATASLLQEAVTNKLKVVKITRDYRVHDDARSEERTYGAAAWQRADGEPDAYAWTGERGKPSKTCEHACVGLVVAGPGRGEAFMVCVAKDKCQVHWAKEIKEKAARDKERQQLAAKDGANGKRTGTSAAQATVRAEVEAAQKLEVEWIKEELADRAADVEEAVYAIIDRLAETPDEFCWNFLMNGDLSIYSWSKIGSHEWSGGGTDHDDDLIEVLLPKLPGKFRNNDWHSAQNGPAARAAIAWMIWMARDGAKFDAQIEKAIKSRWDAKKKAEAKAASSAVATRPEAAKKPAKKGAKPAARKAPVADGWTDDGDEEF